MNYGGLILFVMVVSLPLVFHFILIPKMEKSAENNFNRVYDAVKDNTIIAFKHMDEANKISYIKNVCISTFSNGNFRDGDAELCRIQLMHDIYKP